MSSIHILPLKKDTNHLWFRHIRYQGNKVNSHARGKFFRGWQDFLNFRTFIKFSISSHLSSICTNNFT